MKRGLAVKGLKYVDVNLHLRKRDFLKRGLAVKGLKHVDVRNA